MHRNRYKALIASFILMLLAGGVLLLVQGMPPSEPTFEGRTLRDWIRQSQTFDLDKQDKATQALHQMVPKALPYLVYVLQSRDSKLVRTLDQLLDKQSLTKRRFGTSRKRHLEALTAIYALGPAAASARDEFVRMLHAPATASFGALALAALGEENAKAALLQAMEDKNKEIREAAKHGWSVLYQNPSNGRLILILRDPDYGELALGITQRKDIAR